MYAVLEAPDYESGWCAKVHLVCEDGGDAEFYARSMKDDDIRVEPVQFVPSGRRDLVVEMQVWTVEVDLRSERGHGGEVVGHTADPMRVWSHTEWRAEDVPVSVTCTRSGESVTAIEQGRIQAWHVKATGPTRGQTRDAAQEKLAVLLRQLEKGTLDTAAQQAQRAVKHGAAQ